MPIEIREFVIKSVITDPKNQQQVTGQPGNQQMDQLVSTCVEKVIEIMKENSER